MLGFGNSNKKVISSMKDVVRRFWPILFLFVLWFIFCFPYFFGHKVPFSSTYQVNNFSPWSMYSQFAQPVKNGAMPDVITQIYPWRHVGIAVWRNGEVPLWNMYSFGGTPLLANYQSAVLSPFNLLFFIFPFIDAWSLLVLLQPILAGLGMYWFARQVGVSKWGSLLSSISFMFCGFLVVWMGYATLGYALLFLPFSLIGLEGFFSSRKIRYLYLFSFSLPLSFFSGHFQISLYVLCIIFAYWIYKSFQKKSLLLFSISAVYFLSGMLLCLPQLLPSIEFYSQSLRSGLFQKGEVIPLGYLPTLLAPDFLGNPVTRNDWFGHYAEWNMYIGIIPFFLAFLAFTQWKKSLIKFAFIVGFIAVLLAFDTPIADIFVRLHIPVLSTSALSRVVCVYSFFFALLSGFGLDSLVDLIHNNKKRAVIVVLIVGGFLFAVLWIIVLGKLFMPFEKIVIAKQNLILPTVFFGTFAVVTIGGFLVPKNYRKYLLGLLILITAFDMYRFAVKWQAFDPKSLVTPAVPMISELDKIQGYQRAIGNYGAEVSNYYQLPSLEGYDALYPKRYGEFVSYITDGYLHEADRSVVAFPRNGKYTKEAINLLNVKYVIHKIADTQRGWTFPFWGYPASQFTMLFNDGVYQIFQNNSAYPHAFLVGNYVVATNSGEILNTLFQKIDQRKAIVLEEKPSLKIVSDGNASSKVTHYTADKVVVQTSAKTNMLLFMSDNYYPGWKVYVDGKETFVHRADYTFRAVEVPAGMHQVTFQYQPFSFAVAIIGSFAGLVVTGGIGLLLRRYFLQN